MEIHRNPLRHECEVFYREDILRGFQDTSITGFYFHLTVRERTEYYLFNPDIDHWVHDYDEFNNEENHVRRRAVVSIEDITRDGRRAVEVITQLLRNVGVTDTAEHPPLIEKIYCKAEWLARQFQSVVNKRIPVMVDIVKVYAQAVMDPYYLLMRLEAESAAAVQTEQEPQVASLSMEEDQYNLVPATRASIAALEKVKLSSEGEKCAICLEEMRRARRMACGHMFHGRCIVKWLRMNHVCPVCRFEMPTEKDEDDA